MIRFLHSSDLHLAKPFGRFDDTLKVRLREARFDSIARLAQAARRHDAPLVLLAGDTFDAETPPPQVVRQTLRALEQQSDITWVLLPGNHDSLAASDLWARMARECPGNVHLALTTDPLLLGGDLAILPAPPPVRHPGRDMTDTMGDADTGARVRVGLAHGGVQDFGSDGGGLAVIVPDRPARADLDYLALGDWHGQMQIGPRCWYSGTPEPTDTKAGAPAGALLVEIAAKGAVPQVRPVPTAHFHWARITLDLRQGDDPAACLDAALPLPERRRDAVIEVAVTGRLGLPDRAALGRGLAAVAEDFGYFDYDLTGLSIEQDAGDLDHIDTGGALRATAEALLARATADGGDAALARAALARLYDYAGGTRT